MQWLVAQVERDTHLNCPQLSGTVDMFTSGCYSAPPILVFSIILISFRQNPGDSFPPPSLVPHADIPLNRSQWYNISSNYLHFHQQAYLIVRKRQNIPPDRRYTLTKNMFFKILPNVLISQIAASVLLDSSRHTERWFSWAYAVNHLLTVL